MTTVRAEERSLQKSLKDIIKETKNSREAPVPIYFLYDGDTWLVINPWEVIQYGVQVQAINIRTGVADLYDKEVLASEIIEVSFSIVVKSWQL